MGQVRSWAYDAVIGIGGRGSYARAEDIDSKVNWIGIGPRKVRCPGKRGPLVTFEHFVYFGCDGPDVRHLAPRLAQRMYSRNIRLKMDGFNAAERAEIARVLSLAKAAPASRFAKGSKCRSHRTRCRYTLLGRDRQLPD
jgi:hypothetical protein